MRLTVRAPIFGWVELGGFARLSPERQKKELENLKDEGFEFRLVNGDEPFFPKKSAPALE